MKRNPVRQTVFPLLAALIWGTAFVAQSVGSEHLRPFAFNALRSLIAAAALAAASLVFRALRRRAGTDIPRGPRYIRDLAVGGGLCGLALTLATNLQQAGIETTTAGKAGFLTALYIVIVPLLGIFLHRPAPWTVWVSVAVAVCGLYFLCMQEDFSLAPGDALLLGCSLCFSVQILLVDRYVQRVDGVELSCVQFLVTGLLSLAGMLAGEGLPAPADIRAALWPLLYVGIFSSGVAYTLQILAQKDANPTVLSLLLSLESVFAALSGALLLHDRMLPREILGCVLMFSAVVLAQLPPPRRRADSVGQGPGAML
jgi:drug/metabolite transporter (DMT)-like permease